jgi:NADH:ubiquinone oxidoreductase subunit 2 (subunit N)
LKLCPLEISGTYNSREKRGLKNKFFFSWLPTFQGAIWFAILCVVFKIMHLFFYHQVMKLASMQRIYKNNKENIRNAAQSKSQNILHLVVVTLTTIQATKLP